MALAHKTLQRIGNSTGLVLPAELLREAGLWPLPGTTRLATISQLTTAAAAESGLEVAAEAVESTWQGLLAALHFVNSSSNSA